MSQATRSSPWPRRLRLIFAVAVAMLMLATGALVQDGLRDRLGKADIGLVLGSKVELDGTPSARLQARLDRIAELYRDGYFPLVVTSGGFGKEGFDEAAIMRDYLVAHGVPEERILVDSSGVNTYASARAAERILRRLKLKSVLVVSQYFHVPRARLALTRFGNSPIYSAAPRYFEWRDLFSAPREVVGYVGYLLREFQADSAPE